MQDQLLSAALRYREMGLHIIAVDLKTKKPLVSWREFQKRAPTESELEEMFAHEGATGLAILTGVGDPGVDVIDYDVGHEQWPTEDVELPALHVVRTPSGGEHRYHQHTPGARNSTSVLAARVDVRAEGGYVLAPPTPGYVTLIGSVEEALEATPPAWLQKALLDDRQRPESETEAARFVALLNGVDKGRRNDSAAALAGHYIGLGVPGDETLVILRTWNSQNKPPLSDRELEATVVSIARRELLKGGNVTAEDDRESIMSALSEKFGVGIQDIVRVGGEEPYYLIRVADQQAVIKAGMMASQMAWRTAITEAAERVPAMIGKKEKGGWDHFANLIMAAARRVEPGDDATMTGQLRQWVVSYLDACPPQRDAIIEPRDPVVKDGATWIHAPYFRKFAEGEFSTRLTGQRLTQLLVVAGFARKTIRMTLESGEHTTVSMYRVPAKIDPIANTAENTDS